jgi:cytoskeletal protein CcmA (bactofilin family)
MKKQWWRGLALIGLVALLLFPAVAPSAQAQGGPVVAEHYVLDAGEVVDGDLIVVAQTITITAGSRVAGDAALIGETILVQGQIDGRLTALGDNVTLGEGLQAVGSVTLCADSIVRQDNTAILGEFHANCDQLGTLFTETVPLIFDSSQWEWDELTLPNVDVRRVVAEVNPLGTPVERLVGNLGMSLFMAGLAALVTLFVPLRLRRVSDAALTAPISTTVIGVTTLVASGALSGLVLLSLVLVITICLVPFLGLGWLALGLMLALGLTAR